MPGAVVAQPGYEALSKLMGQALAARATKHKASAKISAELLGRASDKAGPKKKEKGQTSNLAPNKT